MRNMHVSHTLQQVPREGRILRQSDIASDQLCISLDAI